MCGRPVRVGMTVALAATLATAAAAQTQPQPGPPPVATLTMDDAVRLALERNQSLRAQRLTIDESKADELTASLKPNYMLFAGADGFPVFTPSLMSRHFLRQRHAVLRVAQSRVRARRQTRQAYPHREGHDRRHDQGRRRRGARAAVPDAAGVRLGPARQIRAQPRATGRPELSPGPSRRVAYASRPAISPRATSSISLQRLQFDQDVTAAELALVQTKAALRQLLGYETVTEDFEVVGDLAHTKITVTLESLKQVALASRPDLLAAQSGVRLATDLAALEVGNRARNIDGSLNYVRNGFGPVGTLGAGISFDLPFGDRNQGNIAHAQIAVEQARQTEALTRVIC